MEEFENLGFSGLEGPKELLESAHWTATQRVRIRYVVTAVAKGTRQLNVMCTCQEHAGDIVDDAMAVEEPDEASVDDEACHLNIGKAGILSDLCIAVKVFFFI